MNMLSSNHTYSNCPDVPQVVFFQKNELNLLFCRVESDCPNVLQVVFLLGKQINPPFCRVVLVPDHGPNIYKDTKP